MALSATRAIDDAMNTFYTNVMKPTLEAADIPSDKIQEIKGQTKGLITAICQAIIEEIVSNGETVVTTDVNSVISAIKGGSSIPQDGGTGLQSTIVAKLPSSVSGKIK